MVGILILAHTYIPTDEKQEPESTQLEIVFMEGTSSELTNKSWQFFNEGKFEESELAFKSAQMKMITYF